LSLRFISKTNIINIAPKNKKKNAVIKCERIKADVESTASVQRKYDLRGSARRVRYVTVGRRQNAKNSAKAPRSILSELEKGEVTKINAANIEHVADLDKYITSLNIETNENARSRITVNEYP
jgi:hypothetical protein